jgi:hypothetical protein
MSKLQEAFWPAGLKSWLGNKNYSAILNLNHFRGLSTLSVSADDTSTVKLCPSFDASTRTGHS